MERWDIVLVFASLIALGAAVVKPILTLDRTIQTLRFSVDALSGDLKSLVTDNAASHRRCFGQLEEQGKRLENHEGRIGRLEHGAA